ncbi:MAG: helicase HerA-like domain-containing protein [Solirubrobacteraceae bacterium]
MSGLLIAPGLELDADYVGSGTFALLAKKGAGKTYTGRVMAEEFWAASVPFVVLDPMGAWWGLRSSADGESDGIPVAIFGGDHGDAPLERTGGELMADLVVDDGLSMILDMSGFGTRAAERQFALGFLERLYRRNRELVHLFIDEADLFAPQKPQAGDQQLLGVTENIVRRGRNNGIGVTLITQRSAVLNKDVLTQVDGLVAMRMLSPQDRAAIDAWVHDHADMQTAQSVEVTLPTLANGECWWWIPELDLLKRVQVRQSRTFDSSPTKKRGERRRDPRSYADVDMSAIEAKMADTIARAKAEDPKQLRQQIAELRRELKQRPTEKQIETITKTVEVPVLGNEELEQLNEAVDALAAVAGKIIAATNEISGALGKLRNRQRELPQPMPAPQIAPAKTAQVSPQAPTADGVFAPTPAQQRILNALAMLEAIGITDADKTQLALFAATKPTSGGYKNNLGALRNQGGLIEYPSPGTVTLTSAGRAIAEATNAPSTTAELHALVRELVPRAQMAILERLIEAYPDRISREDLAERVDVPSTSGGFKNNLGRLRSLGLIDYPASGYVAALPVLFLQQAA